jgi:hypothetical protein
MNGGADASIVLLDAFAGPFVLTGPPGVGMARAGQIARHALLNALSEGPRKRRRAARTPAPGGGLLTLAQAAAALGIGVRTLRGHMVAGSITYIDVGRGKQRRAPRFAPEDIAAFKLKQRGQGSWPSTREARRTTTNSSFEVVDFAALRAARANEKRKPSRGASEKKRSRRRNVVRLSDETR